MSDTDVDAGTGMDEGQSEEYQYEETRVDEGQPEGQPQSESEGQPESGQEPADEQFGPESKSYKELQRKLSELGNESASYRNLIQQYESQLAPLGGLDNSIKTLNYLASQPSFAEYIKTLQGGDVKSNLGIDLNSADPETRAAIELVEKIADAKSQAAVSRLNQTVSAMVQQQSAERAQGAMSQMDKDFPGWRDVQGEMAEMAKFLSPEIQNNPSYDDFKALYGAAIVKSGKLNDLGESIYKRKIEGLKSKSTEQPRPGGKSAPGKPNTMLEALTMAEKQLGVRAEDVFG